MFCPEVSRILHRSGFTRLVRADGESPTGSSSKPTMPTAGAFGLPEIVTWRPAHDALVCVAIGDPGRKDAGIPSQPRGSSPTGLSALHGAQLLPDPEWSG